MSAANVGGAAGMTLRGSDVPLTTAYDVALLDLDGVVYVGEQEVPGAAAALAAAREAGMRLAFVTNNASRVPDAVVAHLRRLGVPAEVDDVVTSAQAAAHVVADLVPAGSEVLVVGGEGLRVAVRERGLVPVARATDATAAVAQGFARDVNWELLAEGAFAVARGAPWVASNTDRTLPTPRGFAPGNGTLVEVIAMATGRRPDVVAGKPELPLHREATERTGASRPLVVGDRLDTDIEGAVRAGTDSLLVFTGVADPRMLLAAEPARRPAYVSDDLHGLLDAHPAPQQAEGGWCCGGWRVRRGAGGWAAEGAGSRLDGLRALCAAVWASTPTGSADLAEASGALGRIEAAGT